MMNRKKQIQKEKKSKDTELRKIGDFSEEKLFDQFDTNRNGLTEEKVKERLEKYGSNEVSIQKPKSWYILLIEAFKDPFVYVLFLLLIVSAITLDFESSLVMGIMIVISAGIHFVQDFRSQKASEELKEMIETTCAVTRSGITEERPIDEIVPGDIITLSTGDLIPADIRLIQTKDLFVNQSSLTGESLPVEKYSHKKNEENNNHETALELTNLAFMGTDVLSGQGKAVVVKTGDDTFFGDIAAQSTVKRQETGFDRGVKRVSVLLIRFMFIMVPIVFIINGLTSHDWLQAFFFSIAVAVGLTPEMLPVIVTSNLAKGAISMSKKKVIVKELNAIQNLGAMDILCTDKTGTITEDEVAVVKHVSPLGKESERVLDLAYINSNYQTGWKNLIDLAVIRYVSENAFNIQKDTIEKIDEIPFDFSRRRLTVIVRQKEEEVMVTKGALEEMMKVCRYAEIDGEIISLNAELIERMLNVSTEMNKEGMRVLAVAHKLNQITTAEYSVNDEKNMILTGFIGLLDPPKASSIPAIHSLQQQGVTVKVLTGDNEIVSKKVCLDVGIEIGRVISGAEIEIMTDSDLAKSVDESNLFVKLNPSQKAKVIEQLQLKGHTVGFMGDGINDAPALRKADVGVSVDTAADITKETSSIILLEKSLTVLEDGIIEGRRVFSNIMKYIEMTVSSNFGNVFSILVASAFLPFLPMLSIQILVQNLIYDVSQLTIPWDNVDQEEIAVPVKWQTDKLLKFTLFIGPVSSLFDILTFAVMWFIIGANTAADAALFHSGWFVIGLTTQTLVIHIIRTKKIPFIQSKASISLTIATLLASLAAIIIPGSPLGDAINLVSLPKQYWPWMVLILAGYFISVHIAKLAFFKREKNMM